MDRFVEPIDYGIERMTDDCREHQLAVDINGEAEKAIKECRARIEALAKQIGDNVFGMSAEAAKYTELFDNLMSDFMDDTFGAVVHKTED